MLVLLNLLLTGNGVMMQFCTSTVVCWTIISEKLTSLQNCLIFSIIVSCLRLHRTCIQLINDYYSSVMSACMSTLPSKRVTSYHEQHVIPGWNGIVNEKHTMARAAFMEWIYAGKPRQCPRVPSNAKNTLGLQTEP